MLDTLQEYLPLLTDLNFQEVYQESFERPLSVIEVSDAGAHQYSDIVPDKIYIFWQPEYSLLLILDTFTWAKEIDRPYVNKVSIFYNYIFTKPCSYSDRELNPRGHGFDIDSPEKLIVKVAKYTIVNKFNQFTQEFMELALDSDLGHFLTKWLNNSHLEITHYRDKQTVNNIAAKTQQRLQKLPISIRQAITRTLISLP